MTTDLAPRRASALRLSAAALLAIGLVAGCGGSSGGAVDTPVVGGPASTLTSPSPQASAKAAAPQVGGAIIAGSPQPGASTGGSATTTGGGGAAKPPAAGDGKPVTSGGQQATSPGTYTYDNSGTVTAGAAQPVNGSTTLAVDKPSGATQHSVLGGGDQGSTEQTVVRTASGTMLANLKLNNQAFQKEFSPAKPVLLVPKPAKVGATWSWTMTSTDGKTTAALTAKITKKETIAVGGVKTETSVIESTLKLTGDVTYTAQDTINYDETHLIQVRDHTRGSGNVNGFAFTTDITSVLRSLKPS
ncbi:MAG: hypothetical protein ABIO67_03240 [Mycobacteriales bacterium]